MIKTNKSMKNGIQHTERGNAMVYVLIAIVLFGLLTVAMSRQNNQADGQDLSDEVVDLYTNELINYTASAQQTIDMMLMSGSDISDLVFLNPGSAGFDTGSHAHKVFHPSGGGLNYNAGFVEKASPSGNGTWYIQNNLNVTWTDPDANLLPDIILTAANIQQSICENINKKIIGSATIPALTVTIDAIFNPDSYSAASFNTTNCPGCDGYPALCVSNAAADTFAYYNIIAAD